LAGHDPTSIQCQPDSSCASQLSSLLGLLQSLQLIDSIQVCSCTGHKIVSAEINICVRVQKYSTEALL